ncbi:MAG: hypothetical protein HRJ53_28175 [Acidobacteria bacterium Pan2503]|uniref:Uncharacterized protein n=1 Tax=Candidatus Acidiferrum panamense TaxID=2741543 RepID=A0A7V8NWT2_9BACT|nr:hypothetical protein [Candidatus Acidoferrum panamensis]
MPLPAPPGNGIMPSLLGRYFVDCEFILAGAGLIAQPPPTTLTLSPASATPMFMADTTFVTTDDMQDLADANAPLLTAPYVISQSPPPNTHVAPGASVQLTPAQLAIGYPVPTPLGNIPVP